MSIKFYIVDDDRAVRRMLKKIIEEHFESSEVLQSDDAYFALKDIPEKNPDIILLDILMHDIDGLELAEKLREVNFGGRILMISEITSKEIIEKAYSLDADYYITKPINVTEVVSVIRRTVENIKLKEYISLVSRSKYEPQTKRESDLSTRLNSIYKELGILGDPGLDDLSKICIYLYNAKKSDPKVIETSTLTEIYELIKRENAGVAEQISIKGIEQRIRRLAATAMENIVNIGLEDFSNYKFEKYSTSLFNFKSIKQEMDFIRGKSSSRGKIDIKRFIDGLISYI